MSYERCIQTDPPLLQQWKSSFPKENYQKIRCQHINTDKNMYLFLPRLGDNFDVIIN